MSDVSDHCLPCAEMSIRNGEQMSWCGTGVESEISEGLELSINIYIVWS